MILQLSPLSAWRITPFTDWLNTVFAGMDEAVARFAFSLHSGAAGGFFDWFFPAVTLLGKAGIFFIVCGLVALAFRRSRKMGFTILAALLLGLLFTNLALKNAIARPRPYVDVLSNFYTWWKEIGSGAEREIYSFPSGHATASFAAATAVFWCCDKRYSWTAYLLAVLVGFSRIYLMVHYASDIIGGALVGFAAGSLAYLLVSYAYRRFTARKAPAPAPETPAAATTQTE